MIPRKWIRAKVSCGTHHGYKEWIYKNCVGTPLHGVTIAANVRLSYDTYHDTIRIQLYSTVILLFTPDGRFWADNGGFRTLTTTYRLNQFGPPNVFFWHHKGNLRCRYGDCGPGKFMGESPSTKIVVVPPVVHTKVVEKVKVVKQVVYVPCDIMPTGPQRDPTKKRRTLRRMEV